MRQNCYSRVDQRNQYQNPETTQPHPQSGPRIAALEAEGTAETGAAQFNHQEAPRVHSFFASSTQDEKITRGYDSGPTRKLAKPTKTFPPSNQLNHQQGEQLKHNLKEFIMQDEAIHLHLGLQKYQE